MITDSEYRNHNAISQSQLKALLSGIGIYKHVRSNGVHFLLGDAVDILLTQGKQVFDDKYYVSTIKLPSESIVRVVNLVFNDYPYSNDGDYLNAIVEACNTVEYGMKWKRDTRVNKIIKEGGSYWEELKKSYGKTIIDSVQNNTIKAIVESLTTHEFTKDIFNCKSEDQLAIYFNYKGVECKALLDRVNIDDEFKTLQPIDLKTTGDYTGNFRFNARKFRYDIQAAWYTLALEHWKIWHYPDYTILPFQFVVESTKNPGYVPLVYTCTSLDLQGGKEGIMYGDRHYKGYEDAIELYKWHESHSYEYEKEIQEMNGNLNLDLWE